MSPVGRSVRALLLALALPAATAVAQRGSQSATVAVSLRVLPQSSFAGEADQRLTAAVVPGEGWRVPPSSGVRTRMTYTAPAQIVVSGTPLRGPAGAVVTVRFVCAFGEGTTVSAAEPFDCVGGVLAGVDGVRVTSLPLAIGAELSGLETLDVPPGLYSGRVTLTATYPGY